MKSQIFFQKLWKNVCILPGLFCVLASCTDQQFYEKEYLSAAGKKDLGDTFKVGSDVLGDVAQNATNPSLDVAPEGEGQTGEGEGGGETGGGGVVITPNPIPTPVPTPTPVDPPMMCNGGLGYKETQDKFTQNIATNSKVDILWVVDNSGSMAEEQVALARNFEAFISEFIRKNIDFKMAVTTTDGTDKYNGNIVGKSDMLLTSQKAQENENQFIEDFKRIVNVGTRGSGTEVGLATAGSFIKKNGVGFLRPDAFLIIVVLSDEEEQGTKKVQDHVAYYRAQKLNPGMVKVYSIVTTEPLNKWETIGARYAEASKLTGGTVSSIHHDFYVTLRDMGNRIVDLLDSFPLSNAPVNAQFRVLVDNVELKKGWSYDSTNHSVKFDAEYIPDEGSIVIVYYNVTCD